MKHQQQALHGRPDSRLQMALRITSPPLPRLAFLKCGLHSYKVGSWGGGVMFNVKK